MNRFTLCVLTTATMGFPALGLAQDHQHTPGMSHDAAAKASVAATTPREGGQAAFAAVAEIVNLLLADPRTDWGKVNIDALRNHLVDMDDVTIHARVTTRRIAGGAQFTVTGATEPVQKAIQRMVTSHTATTKGQNGWVQVSAMTDDGAVMTVTGPDDVAQAQIVALGFFGLLASGSHHQAHHLMMAKGEATHR